MDAVGDGTVYTCNVTGVIPSEYSGLSTGTAILERAKTVLVNNSFLI